MSETSKELFDSFLQMNHGIPLTLSICQEKYFDIYSDGGVPPIKNYELEKIILFVNGGYYENLLKVTDDCIEEIDQNIFQLSDEILERYLCHISNRLRKVLDELELVSYFKKIRNREIDRIKFDSLTPIPRANFLCIGLFYVAIDDCINCYHKVFNFIDQRKLELYEFTDYKGDSVPLVVGLTHREHALIYKYKADTGIISPNSFNGTEIQKKFGAKRKQAFYSIWDKKGKTYKAPTIRELENILPHLKKYGNAYKAAENDLVKIKDY
ncbi:hypothetical protein ABDJ41_00090 [Pedobacter sp. ASV1-7]|uniref:hypothetical protein n=1 Tax=Pedobacter sp. ASV1-7 TaxID=3145237 RepID=UPI0032E92D53